MVDMSVEQRRALALARARQAAEQGGAAPAAKSGQQIADELGLGGVVPGTTSDFVPPAPPEPSMLPWLDPVTAFANSAVDAIPVAGPTLTNMRQNADALTNSLITGQPYDFDKSWQQQAGFDTDIANLHPEASTAGSVAGAVAPLLALGMTPAGGAVLGNSGSMPQRMMAGGASGASIAGADAWARGASPDEIRMQIAMGLGLGAISPVAERAISPVARALMGRPGPNAATRSVAQGLENANIDPRTIPTRMDALGPDSMLLDLNPNLTRQGGAIAATPGSGQTTLSDALIDRSVGTNSRIQGDVNALLGEAPIPSQLAADIGESRRALSPMYDQVMQGANAVDTRSIADSLDSMIVNERGAAQTALRDLRRDLNIIGTDELDPSPQTLLNIRHKIDGILYTDGAMAPLDSNVARVLGQTRRAVDGELAAKVPGIKDVDAQYSELARQRQGIETGEAILDTGRNTVVRPAELTEMMGANGAPIVGPSGVPFRISQGARAEIDRLIGTATNDITALQSAIKGDGSWNRAKLQTLFGEERADQIFGILERERTYQRSYNQIMGNSETAARQQAIDDVSPRKFNFDIQRLLFGLPEGMANAVARSRSQSVNDQIAEMLVGRPSPELVDRLIAARAANRGVVGSATVPFLLGPSNEQ